MSKAKKDKNTKKSKRSRTMIVKLKLGQRMSTAGAIGATPRVDLPYSIIRAGSETPRMIIDESLPPVALNAVAPAATPRTPSGFAGEYDQKFACSLQIELEKLVENVGCNQSDEREPTITAADKGCLLVEAPGNHAQDQAHDVEQHVEETVNDTEVASYPLVQSVCPEASPEGQMRTDEIKNDNIETVDDEEVNFINIMPGCSKPNPKNIIICRNWKRQVMAKVSHHDPPKAKNPLRISNIDDDGSKQKKSRIQPHKPPRTDRLSTPKPVNIVQSKDGELSNPPEDSNVTSTMPDGSTHRPHEVQPLMLKFRLDPSIVTNESQGSSTAKTQKPMDPTAAPQASKKRPSSKKAPAMASMQDLRRDIDARAVRKTHRESVRPTSKKAQRLTVNVLGMKVDNLRRMMDRQEDERERMHENFMEQLDKLRAELTETFSQKLEDQKAAYELEILSLEKKMEDKDMEMQDLEDYVNLAQGDRQEMEEDIRQLNKSIEDLREDIEEVEKMVLDG